MTNLEYDIRRITLGIPEGARDFIAETSNPLESNLDLMNASKLKLNLVDFHKGCYLGQELVIRTHHTGVIRKRIVPIQVCASLEDFESKPVYKPEPKLKDLVNEVGEKAGKTISKIGTTRGNLGLALVRLEQATSPIQIGNRYLKAFVQL